MESADCKRGRRNGATSNNVKSRQKLGGRFGYFLFFFLLGDGKGESEAPGEGGGSVLS